ncbi:MAG: hypothetical protein ACRDOL_34835 [Streptosporangiaceae bacterium]
MPDNDQHVNSPHLAGRVAVPAGSYGPQPGIPERVTAIVLEEMLADRDAGGARHLLREIENGTGTHKDTDPWQLLQHLLNLGMIRPRETAAGPGEAPAATAGAAVAPPQT